MAKEIADYRKWILNTLLDKYEQSTAFQTGVFKRRILLTASKEKRLQDSLEQVDEKHLFLTVLKQLKDKNLIDYSWVKYEEGNLVDKIWLIPETINLCYKEINRIPAHETLEAFVSMASGFLPKLRSDSDFHSYVRDVIAYAEEKKRIRAPFSDDMTFNRHLLECLVQLENSPNQMERVFSSRIFGDSKYFERTLKSKVISILKEIQKSISGSDEDSANEYLSGDDLLAERGLYRWPEIYEFNGAVTFHMDDGASFDASAQIYGAYLNSDAVKHIASIDGSKIQRVIFIENKASYIDYCSKNKTDDELIVYHGGFYSPVKGMLFAGIHEGCSHASFYHWSDIDLGGFRIFHRLKKNLIPSVQPLFMDVAALHSNAESCMKITSEDYLQKLSALLENPDYSMFFDVIQYMIEHRVRLEQENLVL